MLSADSRRLLEQQVEAGLLAYEHYTVAEARTLIASREPRVRHPILDGRYGRVSRVAVSARVSVTCYEPEKSLETARRPVVVYLHGGGWVFGELATHRLLCARLSAGSGWAVVSVDYRLAPEHRFPAPLKDCEQTLEWLAANAQILGIDTRCVVLAGDSAGGTLAAAMTDQSLPHELRLAGRVLIYPSLDQTGRYTSQYIDIPGMAVTGRTMQWFRSHYFAREADRSSPLASPLRDAVDAVPTLVVTAGYDPLCDEGMCYAELRCGSASCVHRHYPGEVHGFLTVGPDFQATGRVMADMNAFLTYLGGEQ